MSPSSAVASIVLISVFLSTNALLPARHADNDQRDEIDGFLPRNVLPFHYDLEIRPDLSQQSPPFPFNGVVSIYVTCQHPTNQIVLNYNELSFPNSWSVTVVVDPNTAVSAPSPIFQMFELSPTSDFMTLTVNNPLVVGASYIITIEFVGVLRDPSRRGIYYDYYVDRFGITHYLVATQLESIYARAMFPCFDEPDLKATFNTTVVRNSQFISLSNMNRLRTEPRGSGFEADIYAESPIMSTYQVCVIIGEFGFVEADWQGITNYPIFLYARPDMLPYLEFAAKITAPIQAWFEQETGIPYTLPKMDHIALPSKTGAMENWGLITYSEYYLCYNPETSSTTGEIIVAAVVAHELAHQWYGNLVTCKLWNDIWLNEGFATYYQLNALDALGWPGSEIQQSDGSGTQQFFEADARNTSDPVYKVIDNVWQAPSVFSGSTYPKGGAMVRQLRAILPAATWKAGLTRYLNQFSYDSATTDDLFTVLTEQAADDGVTNTDGSPLNVNTIMNPWLRQMGFPLVTVNNAGDGTAEVTWERFFNPLGQTADEPSEYNYEWNVPIAVVTNQTEDWEAESPSYWLLQGQSSITIEGLSTDPAEWSLINPQQLAFYRVNYDNVTRAALVDQLLEDHTAIPSQSRSQLIDDAFILARISTIPETEAMEMTKYLGNESDFNPWYSAIKNWLFSDRIIRKFFWHSNFRSYILARIEPIYNELGWSYNETDSPLTRLLQRDIITTACVYGYTECVEYARLEYAYYRNDMSINRINPNFLPSVLCIGVREGTPEDWSLVFDQYIQRKDSPFRAERFAYLFAMSCSSDTEYLDLFLNYIIRGDVIAPRDQTQALRYMVQSSIGIGVVWQYLDNSWNTVPSTIAKFSILENIVTTFFRNEDSIQFNNFVGKYPPSSPSDIAAFRRMDKTIVRNMDWFNNNQQSLNQWLIDNQPPASKTPKMYAPMGSSAIDFWYSMPLDIEDDA